jgi:hypothetical protein
MHKPSFVQCWVPLARSYVFLLGRCCLVIKGLTESSEPFRCCLVRISRTKATCLRVQWQRQLCYVYCKTEFANSLVLYQRIGHFRRIGYLGAKLANSTVFMKLVIIALVFWSLLYANTSKNSVLNYEMVTL